MSDPRGFVRTPNKRSLSILLTGLLALSACTHQFSDTELIQQAEDYQSRGRWGKSEITLKNALQQNPDNPSARWLLAKYYLHIGNGQAAEKELRHAQRLGTDRQFLAVSMGRALLMQRRWNELLDQVPASRQFAPQVRADILALHGRAYLANGLRERAEQVFNEALALNGQAVSALMGQAYLAMSRRRWEEGRQWVKKALVQQPDNIQALRLLGEVEHAAGRLTEAEQAYSELLLGQESALGDHYNRALVRIQQNDWNGAGQDAEVLASRAPEHPGTVFLDGLFKLKEKNYPEAQTAFEKVLAAGEHPLSWYYLGLVHFIQGHYQQAESYLTSFVARYPNAANAVKILAAVHWNNREPDRAKEVLQKIVDAGLEDSALLQALDSLHLAGGEANEGLEYLRKAASNGSKPPLAETVEQDRSPSSEGVAPTTQADYIERIRNLLHDSRYKQVLTLAQAMFQAFPKDPLPLNFMSAAYAGLGDLQEARAVLVQALELSPGNRATKQNLAGLELRAGNPDRARQWYQEVLEQQPDDLETLLKMVALEVQQAQHARARWLLEQAIAAHPRVMEPRMMLGMLYVQSGELEKAWQILEPMRAIDPDHPQLLSLLGVIAMDSERLGEAVEIFQHWVRIAPRSYGAHYALASAYDQVEEPKRALWEFARTLELNPDYVPARVKMVRLLLRAQQRPEAGAHLAALRKSHANHPEVRLLEAQLAMTQGEFAKAAEIFQSLLDDPGPNTFLVLSLAQAQWRGGQHDKSLDTLSEWLAAYPDDLEVLDQLALLQLKMGLKSDALVSLRELERRLPSDDPAVLNNLAWLLGQEDPDKALVYAKRALAAAPEDPAVLDTLGSLLLEQEQVQEAVQLLERAAQATQHRQPIIGFHLAQSLIALGDLEEARKILQQLVEEDFTDREQAVILLRSLEN